MEIAPFLVGQYEAHPSMQMQDIIKFAYQAAFGAEHLLSDRARAFRFLEEETDAVAIDGQPLTEALSPSAVRVNLSAWKRENLPLEWLMTLFADCRNDLAIEDGTELFRTILDTALMLCRAGTLPFRESDLSAYLDAYSAGGLRPVHHSALYRSTERPAYRLVPAHAARVIPILSKLAVLPRPAVIAVDGRAASGKSTLAEVLSRVLSCPVIHMDDFFLPFELRSKERLAAPGGNVHYERFKEEILPNLRTGKDFSYCPFNCADGTYGDPIPVPAAPILLVEGSYSHHPELGAYADLFVFSDCSEKEQFRRIDLRETPESAVNFRERWIPMEEAYFSAFGIRDHAQLVL